MTDEIIKLIQSKNFKERIQGEYMELSERIRKLENYVNARNDTVKRDTYQDLLEKQLAIMKEYRFVLKQRADYEGVQVIF